MFYPPCLKPSSGGAGFPAFLRHALHLGISTIPLFVSFFDPTEAFGCVFGWLCDNVTVAFLLTVSGCSVLLWTSFFISIAFQLSGIFFFDPGCKSVKLLQVFHHFLPSLLFPLRAPAFSPHFWFDPVFSPLPCPLLRTPSCSFRL